MWEGSFFILVFCMISGVFSQGGNQTTYFTLSLFNDTYASESGAMCMDGSPAGYYIRTGSQTNSSKWVLWFEGGGGCLTPDTCAPRVNTSLGSSRFLPPQPAVSTYSFLTQDPIYNPDFHDWNHIFLFYCSSDLWLGSVWNISALSPGMQYYFSGHLIASAVISTLAANFSLDQATNIIVTGSSAGGAGAFYHADFIANMIPNADVVGVPMAGWSLIGPNWDNYLNNPAAPRDYIGGAARTGQELYLLYNITEFFGPQCIKAVISSINDTDAYWFALGFCVVPPLANIYYSSDMFVANNIYDYVEIMLNNEVPVSQYNTNPKVLDYFRMFGATMTSNLTGIAGRDGVWAPPCYAHTPIAFSIPSAPTIRNMTFEMAFHQWYFTNPRVHMSWIADYSVIWGNCSIAPFKQDFPLFNASSTLSTSGSFSYASAGGKRNQMYIV